MSVGWYSYLHRGLDHAPTDRDCVHRGQGNRLPHPVGLDGRRH